LSLENWRRKQQDQEQWWAILEETNIHKGLQCQMEKKKKKATG